MKVCNENIYMVEKYYKYNGDKYWKYLNGGKVNIQNILKIRYVMEIFIVYVWWKIKIFIYYKVM